MRRSRLQLLGLRLWSVLLVLACTSGLPRLVHLEVAHAPQASSVHDDAGGCRHEPSEAPCDSDDDDRRECPTCTMLVQLVTPTLPEPVAVTCTETGDAPTCAPARPFTRRAHGPAAPRGPPLAI